ncbi:hypothetical protein TSAR_010865 [Trichomalopsis sarcophagae]|uniref:Uncharacterized protein n=1 Tax=Trichomalopsis sarcophagae TaxID=543379 RepID=A0A232EML4_9HYME|nr:hypothetical protein TSAR_010865 [Trichomalopsis sarcophagae]
MARGLGPASKIGEGHTSSSGREDKIPDENADITSTGIETSPALESEASRTLENKRPTPLESAKTFSEKLDAYTESQKLIESQTGSPLAGVRRRRTPRAKPRQKTPSASNTSQKSESKKLKEVRRKSPHKRPKGQGNEETKRSILPSNGPSFVVRVERKSMGKSKPMVHKSHSPHEKRMRERRDGNLRKEKTTLRRNAGYNSSGRMREKIALT